MGGVIARSVISLSMTKGHSMNHDSMFSPARIRKGLLAAVGAVAMLFSAIAAGQSYTYTDRTIDYVGVVSWGQYGGFVGFVEGLPSGSGGQVPYACQNAVAYFDQTQTNSKYWYTAFVTAKASGLHLTVDITQDAYHNCFIAGARLKS